MNNHRRLEVKQRGIALVLVLVLLVVLTLLGTTALSTARIQEQLAGTTYDRLVARSASDAAIADAGDYVLNGAGPIAGPSGYNTILGHEDNDGWTILKWRQNNTNWTVGGASKAIALGSGCVTPGGSSACDGASAQLARVRPGSNPTYIFDLMPAALHFIPLGSTEPPMQVWRATARGVGGRLTTEVYSEIIVMVPG